MISVFATVTERARRPAHEHLLVRPAGRRNIELIVLSCCAAALMIIGAGPLHAQDRQRAAAASGSGWFGRARAGPGRGPLGCGRGRRRRDRQTLAQS